MGIRIKTEGLLVEVDSIQEFKDVVSALNSVDIKKATASSHKRLSGSIKVTDRNLGHFFNSLANTRKAEVLLALKDNPEGMTDEQLRSRVHMESNNALAGILGAISKNAAKAGFQPSQIITKTEQKDKEGKRIYVYQLTKEMAEAIS